MYLLQSCSSVANLQLKRTSRHEEPKSQTPFTMAPPPWTQTRSVAGSNFEHLGPYDRLGLAHHPPVQANPGANPHFGTLRIRVGGDIPRQPLSESAPPPVSAPPGSRISGCQAPPGLSQAPAAESGASTHREHELYPLEF